MWTENSVQTISSIKFFVFCFLVKQFHFIRVNFTLSFILHFQDKRNVLIEAGFCFIQVPFQKKNMLYEMFE
jgi:hypothetical protein